MAKFFAKINNLRIALTPTIPGNPYLQIPTKNGITVKFTDGFVELDDERDAEVIKMLRSDKKCGKDYFEEKADPFSASRQQFEPVHDIMELRDGRPGPVTSSQNAKPSKSIQDQLRTLAMEMAREMVQAAGIDLSKVDKPAPAPAPAMADDEPMDRGAAEEVGEVYVPAEIIGAKNEPAEADDVNPLESTLPEPAVAETQGKKQVKGKK